MAYLLRRLRNRNASALGVYRILQDNVDSLALQQRFKLRAFVASGVITRKYSSGSGTAKFDFTDLTCPHMWYPIARTKKRKVIFHVGPTNSGKTYSALKQFELSSSGIYCGPLRLLAWEVAKRLNKAKVPCDLITGQEREEVEGAMHKAVTVEMADVTSRYNCAIIDEIQMVGCKTRGYSFTRALLGIAADELHLCGDPAALPLIQEILKVTGDLFEVHSYDRLSPLVPLKVPLGSFSDIQTGDCIVTFSRQEIYKLKKKIETGSKQFCSIVYGSLPPEIRTRQATRFNDESSEFDVLVATDAIGMGLNLNISRIIFSTMQKFDGVEMRDLTVSEIKQIAGRAGRYKSKFPVGEVTCLYADDLPLLHSALSSPSPDLECAGLFPTFDLMSMYSHLHPEKGLYQILEFFLENAKLSKNYFIADCEDTLKVAAIIDELPLGLQEKYLFCVSTSGWCLRGQYAPVAQSDRDGCYCGRYSIFESPVDINDEISTQGLTQFARNYATKGVVRLREIFTPGTLQVPKTQSELKELESVHKVLDLYVWLSFRLEDSFPDREVAASQKAMCNLLIEEFLEGLGWQKPRGRRLPIRSKCRSLLSKDVHRYL